MLSNMSPLQAREALWLALGLGALGASCADSEVREVYAETEMYVSAREHPIGPAVVDTRRALVVTELAILERFSLRRVLDQLAAQSGDPRLTGITLFRQWWDTQNPGPGLGLGPHCDDVVDPTYGPAINGYPYDCRPAPAEGAHASCTSFEEAGCAYLPIGLFNRFDLAPADGAHCGEYRIVYAKRSGQTDAFDRNLLIFEATLPNPSLALGLDGCRPIVQTWASLSQIPSVNGRAAQLERFYFQGGANVPPVIHVAHFGDNALGVGQIRTNQFMGQAVSRVWTTREFKLRRSCEQGACTLRFMPDTTKINPYGALFDASSSDPRATSFQASFAAENVASLAASELTNIAMSTADTFNTAQSHSSGSAEMSYLYHFGVQPSAFRTSIQNQLTGLGSALTPDQIVARALTQTCAGCHRMSNGADLGGGLTWPHSLGFVHVTEREVETVDGALRYRISSALEDVFLPVRKQVMEDFLDNRSLRARGKGATIGGRGTH